MITGGAKILVRTLLGLVLASAAGNAQAIFGSGFNDILDRKWSVYESRHFRIISDADETVVSRQIHDMELFRTYVRATMGFATELQGEAARRDPALRKARDAQPVAEEDRIDVYLLSRRAYMIRLFNSRDAYGFMRPGLRKSVMVIAPEYDTDSPNSVAFHEYVHFLLRAVGGTHFPPWYEEGLAEFFAATRFSRENGGEVIMGEAPLLRLHSLSNRQRFPVDSILRAGSPWLLKTNNGTDRPAQALSRAERRSQRRLASIPSNPIFYAQSWSLIHMLLLGHHAGMPRRDHLLADYVLDIQQGREPEAALRHHFAGAGPKLERDLRRYLTRRSQIPRIAIPMNQFDYDPRYQRRPVELTELADRLGRLVAPVSPLVARKLYARALEEAPESAPALAGMGVTQRLSGRLSTALDLVGQSLTRAPEDPRVNFDYADTVSLICRSYGSSDAVASEPRVHESPAPASTLENCSQLVPRAMQNYARALELMPDNTEYKAYYGVALLQGGDPEGAYRLLRDAFEGAPWSPGVSFALGESLRRMGRFDEAMPYLQRASVWFFKAPRLQVRAKTALELARLNISEVPKGANSNGQFDSLN